MHKMTPSAVGERAEMAVAAALVYAGKRVYIPFSASGRVDLVFEDEDGFHRVQCKAGRQYGNAIVYMTCSRTNNQHRDYRGDNDFFGVYCDARREVYLVPIDDAPGSAGSLRVAPTQNGQAKRIRWAADYLLTEAPPVPERRT